MGVFYLQLLRMRLGMPGCIENVLVLISNSFRGFDGGGGVQEFNESEDDNMFLSDIYGLFLGYSGEFTM